MERSRKLLIVADHFGIGPEVSRGILDAGQEGLITAASLLVNSPFAVEAVLAWRRAGRTFDLGWQANLTLDHPICMPEQVPSLVGSDGAFLPVKKLLKRWMLNQLSPAEITRELQAQQHRYQQLVGWAPSLVNSHQHVALIPPIGKSLLNLLQQQRPWPYLRRVTEPLSVLARIPGGRSQRIFLRLFGRRLAQEQALLGFPGNDGLAGLGNDASFTKSGCFARWLERTPGQVIELVCHPGHIDATLKDRHPVISRRPLELEQLRHADFMTTARKLGLELVSPSQMIRNAARPRQAA